MNPNNTRHRLNTLYMARQTHLVAEPLLRRGDMSLSRIYLNHVLMVLPISLSTFYRYMRITTDGFAERLALYREHQITKYLHNNARLRQRRKAARKVAAG
ncbi:MAG: hypothetical protein J1D86_02775 [Alistipes sp.]|nr:hypothetical protein [Alistipes sp.]